MIQITVTNLPQAELLQTAMADFQLDVQKRLEKLFPYHAVFVFFVGSELESTGVSVKVEVVSKKGIRSKALFEQVTEAVEVMQRTTQLRKVPIAIYLTPWKKLNHVAWINPQKDIT